MLKKKRIAAAIRENSDAFYMWKLIDKGMKPRALELLLSKLYLISHEGGFSSMFFTPSIIDGFKKGLSSKDIFEMLEEEKISEGEDGSDDEPIKEKDEDIQKIENTKAPSIRDLLNK